MDVMTLLSILENHPFCIRSRDVRIWNPNPSDGFSCKSFYQCLINLSPWVSRYSLRWGGLRSLERLDSLFGRFSTVVLVHRTGLQGRCCCWLGLVVSLVGRRRKTWPILCGIVSWRALFGMLSFIRLAWVVFVIELLVIWSRSPSSICHLGSEAIFFGLLVFVLFYGCYGVRNSGVFRGLEGEWRLVVACPSSCLSLGFDIKAFCNYPMDLVFFSWSPL